MRAYARDSIKKLKEHVYHNRKQFAQLRTAKESLKEGTVILLCDFSENFHCRFQKEVMAAHWKKDTDGQVTIYTCVIYFLNDGTIDHKSFAILSDTLRHSHREVAFFNEHILEEMTKTTNIDEVIVWSDDRGFTIQVSPDDGSHAPVEVQHIIVELL